MYSPTSTVDGQRALLVHDVTVGRRMQAVHRVAEPNDRIEYRESSYCKLAVRLWYLKQTRNQLQARIEADGLSNYRT